MTLLSGLLVLFGVSLLFSSCKEKDIDVTGITLSPTEISIGADETATITATVSPSDATNKTVTWASSDASIATVDAGKVKAIAEGEATITATTNDGNYSATCIVTVEKGPDPSFSVTFGTASWTAAVMTATEQSSPAVMEFWAGKTTIDIEDAYPIVNFITSNTSGSTSFSKNGDYLEYYENRYLFDDDYFYGDWWVETGSGNITKFSARKISGTGTATMYDAYNYHAEGGSGDRITKEISFTFSDIPVQTGAKMLQALKVGRETPVGQLRASK